jgi:uncharacterized protein (DUF433 family)
LVRLYVAARHVSKGTRIIVSVVLDSVLASAGIDELLKCYRTLSAEDVQAALEYASELERERTVSLPSGVG